MIIPSRAGQLLSPYMPKGGNGRRRRCPLPPLLTLASADDTDPVLGATRSIVRAWSEADAADAPAVVGKEWHVPSCSACCVAWRRRARHRSELRLRHFPRTKRERESTTVRARPPIPRHLFPNLARLSSFVLAPPHRSPSAFPACPLEHLPRGVRAVWPRPGRVRADGLGGLVRGYPQATHDAAPAGVVVELVVGDGGAARARRSGTLLRYLRTSRAHEAETSLRGRAPRLKPFLGEGGARRH